MRAPRLGTAILMTLVAVTTAHADDVAGKIEITADGAKFKVTLDNDHSNGKFWLEGANGKIAIKLPAGRACSDLSAELLNPDDNSPVGKPTIEPGSGNGCLVLAKQVPPTGYLLSLKMGSTPVTTSAKLLLMPRAENRSDPDATDTGSITLADALSCTSTATNCGDCYQPKTNTAHFEVTAVGTVLHGPTSSIDENDAIEVTVHAHRDLIPFLQVRRTSAIRNTDDLRIVGKDIKLPQLGGSRQASGEPCSKITVFLRDFAPGPATVTISARVGEKSIDLGSFEFVVNRLYHGVLGFGPVASAAKPTHYTIVDRAGTSVIEETRAKGDGKLSYAFTYTAFIKRRDLEKDLPWKSWERVNPTLGFLTQDPHLNALIGLSYDLPTIMLTVGVHLTQGERLTKQSRLFVGAPFDGQASAIPRRDVLESGLFASVQLDLRAALALIGAMGAQ